MTSEPDISVFRPDRPGIRKVLGDLEAEIMELIWARPVDQGTTVRDDDGKRRQAYDIFVRGGLGPDAAIGRPLFRRVPTDGLEEAVAGLVAGWLDGRQPDESFTSFTRRLTDDELGALAGLEPARKREREEEEAA